MGQSLFQELEAQELPSPSLGPRQRVNRLTRAEVITACGSGHGVGAGRTAESPAQKVSAALCPGLLTHVSH